MPQTFYLNWLILGILFFTFHYLMFMYFFYLYIGLVKQMGKKKFLRASWWN
uniref:ATP synthase F0 subunit 8 n=1 Tax=Bactrothrips quadrituberculatus TaxID=1246465 RepID=A0A8E5NM86_9NEOP|nr:ATP synthase F0 subunit 8 [Bactrothrips quadrituberculatus]QVD42817.1 ATP synthase F0 subunit 8 [Bactrothrips quadrituberculatus]